MADKQSSTVSEETRVSIMATTLYDLYQQWVREGKPKKASQDA